MNAVLNHEFFLGNFNKPEREAWNRLMDRRGTRATANTKEPTMSAVFQPNFTRLSADLRDGIELERRAALAENAEFMLAAQNSERKAHASVNYTARAVEHIKEQLFADDVLVLAQALRAKVWDSGNRHQGWVESVLDELGSVIRTCMDQSEEDRIDSEREKV